MNIHEFQAKDLFRQAGLYVAPGIMVSTVSEALEAGKKLFANAAIVAVKAQIHAGGRGKSGGVRLAKSPDEVAELSSEMLGMCLVTPQTGPEGKVVNKLYLEAGVEIARELYFSIVLDRKKSAIAIIASEAGGVDIEEVAHATPEKIRTITVDPLLGLRPFQVRQLISALHIPKEHWAAFSQLINKLYSLFVEKHMVQLEINPLIVDSAGQYMPLDAKIAFDDNALPLPLMATIAALSDESEEEPLETRAKKSDLSYIKMDGEIGCMVNGAGLAMATMDIIHLYGGKAANFLDVGGGATAAKVAEGFRIITSDPNVKGIFVNIFGGIMRCDIIASGIIEAARELNLTLPVIIRLDGTNAELGRNMLQKVEGLSNIHAAAALDEAAQLAVKLTR